MFKSLKSTLLGNILSPTYCTTIWKPDSGNKVPGSFPNNISCLKIGIREIHQRKSYFHGRMKCKQQGNWKKQFDQREVCGQLTECWLAPQNSWANGRHQKFSIFTLPCWANQTTATYLDVSCQWSIYAEFPKEGKYPTEYEELSILVGF